jgi:hypothetical protein
MEKRSSDEGTIETAQTDSADSAPPVYGCTVDKCPRHYDVMAGYFDVIDGKTLADKYGKRSCAKDGMALHVEAYLDETEEETWRCPEAACSHRASKSTRLPEFLLVC